MHFVNEENLWLGKSRKVHRGWGAGRSRLRRGEHFRRGEDSENWRWEAKCISINYVPESCVAFSVQEVVNREKLSK